MDRDLLKKLDLGAKLATLGGKKSNVAGKPTTSEEASPSAIILDEWDRQAGRNVLERCPRMQYDSLSATDAADLFAAAYKMDPKIAGACVDPDRHAFLKGLLASSDFQQTRANAVLNEPVAEMVAASIGSQFATFRKGEKEKRAKDTEARKAGRLRSAIYHASRKAAAELDEMEEVGHALGFGEGMESGERSKTDQNKVVDSYLKVRNNGFVRKVMELAGAYRRMAQAKQRQKTGHGMDDVVGVTMDGDVSRLVASELARLGDDDFNLDAMRRLIERQSQCREHIAKPPVAKGPILVCVDESSSMEEDQRIHNAKALALAMAWIARKQNRWCGLIGFSNASQRRKIVLPPGHWDDAELLQWIGGFFDRGTSIPLFDLPAMYTEMGAPPGKTDIILITDGECYVDVEVARRFNEWKQTAKAKLFTIGVGCSSDSLRCVSDANHDVSALTVGSSAVSAALSI